MNPGLCIWLRKEEVRKLKLGKKRRKGTYSGIEKQLSLKQKDYQRLRVLKRIYVKY